MESFQKCTLRIIGISEENFTPSRITAQSNSSSNTPMSASSVLCWAPPHIRSLPNSLGALSVRPDPSSCSSSRLRRPRPAIKAWLWVASVIRNGIAHLYNSITMRKVFLMATSRRRKATIDVPREEKTKAECRRCRKHYEALEFTWIDGKARPK